MWMHGGVLLEQLKTVRAILLACNMSLNAIHTRTELISAEVMCRSSKLEKARKHQQRVDTAVQKLEERAIKECEEQQVVEVTNQTHLFNESLWRQTN